MIVNIVNLAKESMQETPKVKLNKIQRLLCKVLDTGDLDKVKSALSLDGVTERDVSVAESIWEPTFKLLELEGSFLEKFEKLISKRSLTLESPRSRSLWKFKTCNLESLTIYDFNLQSMHYLPDSLGSLVLINPTGDSSELPDFKDLRLSMELRGDVNFIRDVYDKISEIYLTGSGELNLPELGKDLKIFRDGKLVYDGLSNHK